MLFSVVTILVLKFRLLTIRRTSHCFLKRLLSVHNKWGSVRFLLTAVLASCHAVLSHVIFDFGISWITLPILLPLFAIWSCILIAFYEMKVSFPFVKRIWQLFKGNKATRRSRRMWNALRHFFNRAHDCATNNTRMSHRRPVVLFCVDSSELSKPIQLQCSTSFAVGRMLLNLSFGNNWWFDTTLRNKG